MKKFILICCCILLLKQITSAQCAPPSKSAYLDVNNISALITNRGDIWWDGVSTNHYEFSKGSGKHLFFSKGIWLSGVGNNNQLKTAAVSFSSHGSDFYPGPLQMNTTSLNPFSCSVFDKILR